jgi:hypothetical protein
MNHHRQTRFPAPHQVMGLSCLRFAVIPVLSGPISRPSADCNGYAHRIAAPTGGIAADDERQRPV